jgi:hypothetical protein
MNFKKMTEQEVFQIAEVGDLLGDYGYEDEADLLAQVCENEQIMLYTPTASPEQRQPAKIWRKRDVENAALTLAEKNSGNGEYSRALTELIIALNKQQ